jgi:hypothetical protein
MENGDVSVIEDGMIKMPRYSVSRWDSLMAGQALLLVNVVLAMCG